MQDKKHLIVIGGATASGKTNVAIQVAQHFNTEIVSADSRQFYKEMSIGTAKPSLDELKAVKHHFINSVSIHDTFSVGDFERQSLELLDQLFQKYNQIVLVGGSGLYIRALCEGLDKFPAVDPAIREQLNEDFEEKGIRFLQKELSERDPDYFKIVDKDNPQRLVRALEVCLSSGQAYSSFRKETKADRPFDTINIQLTWDRAELYDRINQRVDQMIQNGLVAEARTLAEHKHLNALKTVGYQELFDYFDKITDLDTAIELIKRNSRRYAKRQLTWLRKDDFWELFSPDQTAAIVEYIQSKI